MDSYRNSVRSVPPLEIEGETRFMRRIRLDPAFRSRAREVLWAARFQQRLLNEIGKVQQRLAHAKHHYWNASAELERARLRLVTFDSEPMRTEFKGYLAECEGLVGKALDELWNAQRQGKFVEGYLGEKVLGSLD